MEFDIPDLHQWDSLSTAQCESIARAVASCLPGGWRLTKVRECSDVSRRRNVAFFDYQGATFVLIIGGQVTLGYDPNYPPLFTPEQQRDYDQSRPKGKYGPLSQYLQRCMTPVRRVNIRPFLLESIANGPSVLERPSAAERPDATNAKKSHRDPTPSYKQVSERLEQQGFRLPTSDEWEHACSAGSRALWRWGSACPPISTEDWQSFDLHSRPNGFGILIAHNPSEWEWCTNPNIRRGGDGGDAFCGGDGEVVSWLSLASPYTHPMLVSGDTSEGLHRPCYDGFRRAWSL